jgi:chromosome segregation ATPase
LKNQGQVDVAELQLQIEEKDETIAELTEEVTKFADDVEQNLMARSEHEQEVRQMQDEFES